MFRVQSFVFSAGLLWEYKEWKCSVLYNHTLITHHLLSVYLTPDCVSGIFILHNYPVSTGIVGILQLIIWAFPWFPVTWCHFKGVDIYCQCLLAPSFIIMPALIFFAHVIIEPASNRTAATQTTNLLLLHISPMLPKSKTLFSIGFSSSEEEAVSK